MGCVDAFYGPTHERARSRGARRGSLQCLLRGAVRPVRGTGPTDRRAERRRSDERQGCPRLGRPARASSDAMETRDEQHVEVGKARVKEKKLKTMKDKCI